MKLLLGSTDIVLACSFVCLELSWRSLVLESTLIVLSYGALRLRKGVMAVSVWISGALSLLLVMRSQMSLKAPELTFPRSILYQSPKLLHI